jgi:hypothetical protein
MAFWLQIGLCRVVQGPRGDRALEKKHSKILGGLEATTGVKNGGGPREGEGGIPDIQSIHSEVFDQVDIIVDRGTLSSASIAAPFAACTTNASYASWGKSVLVVTSSNISGTMNVDRVRSTSFARHGRRGSMFAVERPA